MELKTLLAVFGTIFLAELGDKTQLATLLFAADGSVHKLPVFLAASAALVVATGIGVVAGGLVSRLISPRSLHYVAGTGFVAIGIWTIARA